MNSLDDLLTAAGQVPDISPGGLREGRDALEAAFKAGPGGTAPVYGRRRQARRACPSGRCGSRPRP